MKVLLFTHKSDIDGMGNVVLAKLAFTKVEYRLCETFNLQNEIKKYYDNKTIYDYDRIIVTDMWLEEPTLNKIAKDKKLKDKFFVFDHHKSALKEGCNKYPFTTIKITDERGMCSGTSLFYEYLIENKFIDIKREIIREFSELTRKYDTWEWKTKYYEELPHELTLLFDAVGCENYIEFMFEKLKENKNRKFIFNEIEEMFIRNKKDQTQEKLENYVKKVYYTEVLGQKAGIVFIDYEYRNDLAEYLRSHNFDMDFAMLIALDYGTISYRSIKEEVNVRKIAEFFGGKGHDKTASSPISEEQKRKLIDLLIKKER